MARKTKVREHTRKGDVAVKQHDRTIANKKASTGSSRSPIDNKEVIAKVNYNSSGLYYTKSVSEREKVMEKYILDNINPEDYDVIANTPKEKLEFLRNTIKSEYGWRIKQIGLQKGLSDWLQGLPNAINIHFYNSDILNFSKDELGIKFKNEKAEDKIIENWFEYLSAQIVRVSNKYKVSYY